MTIETPATTVGEWVEAHEPIVVGVDGSERNRSAVAWAVDEATDTGSPLLMVTALTEHLVPRSGDAPGNAHEQRALAMLDQLRARVAGSVDPETVSTRTRPGTPVEALLEAAGQARLVVVGKRGLGGFARLIVGSTSIALAGRSPSPVAIVPDSWDARVGRDRPVVLGVDPFRSDPEPTELAFGRAERLGVALLAVHGWETPAAHSWDDDMVAGALHAREHESRRHFDDLLATWAQRYPQVPVHPLRRHGHPANALLEAAEEGQVLVLGRHQQGRFGGLTLGSVARAVLHYADTPVIVAPVAAG